MRTMGATRNCEGCRFWSEMLAMAEGGGPVQAMCLCHSGPKRGKYMTGRNSCPEWKSGHLGAVDDPCEPGDETWRLYAQEDAAGEGRGKEQKCNLRGTKENKHD